MDMTDYTIISKPDYIKFICPHCKNAVKQRFDTVDFKTDCWSDGAWTDCCNCGEEVELGAYEYE